MADLPGGASGLLVREYRGKEADRLVTRLDPGVVALVAELRGQERQAAEEAGQGKTRVEERKILAASPAAITLATLLTDEELSLFLLVAELRGHERQAAEEPEQWKTRIDEHKPLDASPAATMLAVVFTTAELGN